MTLTFLPPPPQWELLSPEEKIEHTREQVVTLGRTYSAAAAALGTTRHGIAGAIERSTRTGNPIRTSSGLKNQNSTPKGAAGGRRDAKTKAANKARAKPKTRSPRLGSFLRLPSEIPVAGDIEIVSKSDAWGPLPGSTPVAIADHVSGCRWPTGADLPFHYCNEPVTGEKVYCAAHAAIAYREPPPRKDNGRRDSA